MAKATHENSLRASFAVPIFHKLPSLLKQVAPPVCGLDLIADSVGESHLNDLSRVIGFLCRPVSERRSEAVRCVLAVYPAIQIFHQL